MDKLRSMQYFVRVAETRSFGAAALVLGVSPSAVSKVIAAFESTLGFALFHRTTRKLGLTDAGARFLEECNDILQRIEQAESRGRARRANPAGLVKIAMHPAFRMLFFDRLKQFLDRHEGMRIETLITNSPSPLFDSGFDLLIRVGELPDSTLVARRIGWVEFVIGASPAYLASYGTPRSPAELENHRWAIPARVDDGSGPHYEFARGNQRYEITIDPCVRARDGTGLIESVVGGACIACLYDIAFANAIAAGRVKALLPNWKMPGRPVYAVFPTSRAITPKTQALVDFCAQIVAGTSPGNAPARPDKSGGRVVPLRPFRRRTRARAQ